MTIVQPTTADEPTKLGPALDSVTSRKTVQNRPDGDRSRREAESRWGFIEAAFGSRYKSAGFSTFATNTESQRNVFEAVKSYAADFPARRAAGDGMLLYGPVGTGKDHLAISALRVAVLYHHATAAWIDGQTFFARMRDKISSESSEAAAIEPFLSPDVLLISDPLPGNADRAVTDFQQSVLWRIIDRRYRDLKPTWLTMNVASSEEANARLGIQLVDRLGDGALICSCNWPTARKPRLIVK